MGFYGQAHCSMSQNLTHTKVPRVLTQREVSPRRAFIVHKVSISASEIRFYYNLGGGEVRLNFTLGFRTVGHFSCRVISVERDVFPSLCEPEQGARCFCAVSLHVCHHRFSGGGPLWWHLSSEPTSLCDTLVTLQTKGLAHATPVLSHWATPQHQWLFSGFGYTSQHQLLFSSFGYSRSEWTKLSVSTGVPTWRKHT